MTALGGRRERDATPQLPRPQPVREDRSLEVLNDSRHYGSRHGHSRSLEA